MPGKRKPVPTKRTCDSLFSRRIRARDGACVVCGSVERLQCAHIISRRYLSVRWDDDNAVTLCARDHMYFTHRPLEWERWVENRIGADAYADLRRRALELAKPDYNAISLRLGGVGSPATHRIDYLQPGDPIPEGEPRRYTAGNGYIRLRWKVGKQHYVEAWEHRLVAEAPDGLEVHHINGIRDDNRPENLQLLAKDAHASLQKIIDIDVIRPLYESGLSTPEIARRTGWEASAIYRTLQQAGVRMRTSAEVQRAHVDADLIEGLARAGCRAKWIANLLGHGPVLVAKVMRERGVPPHPVGRPAGGSAAQEKLARAWIGDQAYEELRERAHSPLKRFRRPA